MLLLFFCLGSSLVSILVLLVADVAAAFFCRPIFAVGDRPIAFLGDVHFVGIEDPPWRPP